MFILAVYILCTTIIQDGALESIRFPESSIVTNQSESELTGKLYTYVDKSDSNFAKPYQNDVSNDKYKELSRQRTDLDYRHTPKQKHELESKFISNRTVKELNLNVEPYKNMYTHRRAMLYPEKNLETNYAHKAINKLYYNVEPNLFFQKKNHQVKSSPKQIARNTNEYNERYSLNHKTRSIRGNRPKQKEQSHRRSNYNESGKIIHNMFDHRKKPTRLFLPDNRDLSHHQYAPYYGIEYALKNQNKYAPQKSYSDINNFKNRENVPQKKSKINDRDKSKKSDSSSQSNTSDETFEDSAYNTNNNSTKKATNSRKTLTDQRRYWLVNQKPIKRANQSTGYHEEKDSNLKHKIATLVEQTIHDTERKISTVQHLKEKYRTQAPYKTGFILSMIKKSRDVMNELFNVAVKHRDQWKALEQLKVFELIVHTNVDTTNLVRQLVEIHVQYLNETNPQNSRKNLILL